MTESTEEVQLSSVSELYGIKLDSPSRARSRPVCSPFSLLGRRVLAALSKVHSLLHVREDCGIDVFEIGRGVPGAVYWFDVLDHFP